MKLARLAGAAILLAALTGCGGSSDDATPTTTRPPTSTSTTSVEVASLELGTDERPASLDFPPRASAPGRKSREGEIVQASWKREDGLNPLVAGSNPAGRTDRPTDRLPMRSTFVSFRRKCLGPL